MCGICGYTVRDGVDTDRQGVLDKMLVSIAHRGPDGCGKWVDGKVALGHARLSIIDLSAGDQPMVSDAGNVIVFNGEIYNYKEIRENLSAKGYRFKTQSDTEVILHAYDEFGEGCVDLFVGMFAFVLYLPKENRLFFARDRLGKKPFFYTCIDGVFAFASEIKALMNMPMMRSHADLDPEAIYDYFSIGYILAPKTIFNNIRKLPAAYKGSFSLFDKQIKVAEYWDLADRYNSAKASSVCNESDFMHHLDDAVRLRLRSDVPLGAFLSGGVDSSAVAESMCRLSSRTVQAYCIGFPREESYDESKYAKIVAGHVGANLKVLDEPYPDGATLNTLAWHFDEPFCDTSLIPTYQVCQAARRYVTVILSGDGADELFAGYSTYMADVLYRYWAKLPLAFHRASRLIVDSLVRPSYKKVSFDYKLKQFLGSSGMSREEAHYHWRVIFAPNELGELFSPDFFRAMSGYSSCDTFKEFFSHVKKADFLDQSLYVDVKTWLQDDILVKVDRMSMANSLEVRSPFLDHKFVEFAASLPKKCKINGIQQKVALKRSMKNRLPSGILRRPKRGFNFPVMSLASDFTGGLYECDFINSNFSIDEKRCDVSFKRFSIIMFNEWYKIYINYLKTGSWGFSNV